MSISNMKNIFSFITHSSITVPIALTVSTISFTTAAISLVTTIHYATENISINKNQIPPGILIVGKTNPSNNNGTNGDFYLNLKTCTIYGPKTNNTWPPTGIIIISNNSSIQMNFGGGGGSALGSGNENQQQNQAAGGGSFSCSGESASSQSGGSILSGNEAPSANTPGRPGDFYLDLSTYTLYGPAVKTQSGLNWGTGVTLVGPKGAQGPRGATWFVGGAPPTSTTPANAQPGDLYLDTSTGTYYEFSSQQGTSNWIRLGNLTGPEGQRGTVWFESNVPPNDANITNAATGDLYMDTQNGAYYRFNGSKWIVLGNLTGPQGSRGATWFEGTSAPSSSQPAGAQNGDFYLDTANGNYYQLQNSSWVQLGNLTGAPGTNIPIASGGSNLPVPLFPGGTSVAATSLTLNNSEYELLALATGYLNNLGPASGQVSCRIIFTVAGTAFLGQLYNYTAPPNSTLSSIALTSIQQVNSGGSASAMLDCYYSGDESVSAAGTIVLVALPHQP